MVGPWDTVDPPSVTGAEDGSPVAPDTVEAGDSDGPDETVDPGDTVDAGEAEEPAGTVDTEDVDVEPSPPDSVVATEEEDELLAVEEVIRSNPTRRANRNFILPIQEVKNFDTK